MNTQTIYKSNYENQLLAITIADELLELGIKLRVLEENLKVSA